MFQHNNIVLSEFRLTAIQRLGEFILMTKLSQVIVALLSCFALKNW